jgi:hypothetical protein
MFDPELESFKTAIDLRAYAGGQGYTLDRKESWTGSAVMRHANGDKIIIKRDVDMLFTGQSDSRIGTISSGTGQCDHLPPALGSPSSPELASTSVQEGLLLYGISTSA